MGRSQEPGCLLCTESRYMAPRSGIVPGSSHIKHVPAIQKFRPDANQSRHFRQDLRKALSVLRNELTTRESHPVHFPPFRA